jgi:hypothetical protein
LLDTNLPQELRCFFWQNRIKEHLPLLPQTRNRRQNRDQMQTPVVVVNARAGDRGVTYAVLEIGIFQPKLESSQDVAQNSSEIRQLLSIDFPKVRHVPTRIDLRAERAGGSKWRNGDEVR